MMRLKIRVQTLISNRLRTLRAVFHAVDGFALRVNLSAILESVHSSGLGEQNLTSITQLHRI